MVGSINRLVKWVGIIIIPIGCVLFFQSYSSTIKGFMTALSPWKRLDWDDSGRVVPLTTVALVQAAQCA